MKINKYPDGSSYAIVENNLEKLNEREGYSFTYRINSYEDLWHLGQILEVMEWKGASPIVTIPNLIDAQADRRFDTNQSFGLKMVCQFLDNYKSVCYHIFHPHNPEVVEALMGNVDIIDNSEFIAAVLYDIRKNLSPADGRSIDENLILMSSDAGGFKPLIKLCNKIDWQGETYSASKAREFHMGETTLVQKIDRQDFKGKDILIIDDICVYGGTFKNLANMLRERNCGKLYLAVSHMTVQNLGENPVTKYFDRVYTTNSKYDEYYTERTLGSMMVKNLEIIKLF